MTTKEGQADLRESTLPASAQVVVEQIEGDGTEALAMFEDFLRELAHIGRSHDLSTLDGLTVVNDIRSGRRRRAARGRQFPPTIDDVAVCGASANHVMRDGKLKSHILVRRDIASELWTGTLKDCSLNSEPPQLATHACGLCRALMDAVVDTAPRVEQSAVAAAKAADLAQRPVRQARPARDCRTGLTAARQPTELRTRTWKSPPTACSTTTSTTSRRRPVASRPTSGAMGSRTTAPTPCRACRAAPITTCGCR